MDAHALLETLAIVTTFVLVLVGWYAASALRFVEDAVEQIDAAPSRN